MTHYRGEGTSRRRIGRALDGQIRKAAARGRGVRLTADDVRSLVDGNRAAAMAGSQRRLVKRRAGPGA